MRLMLYAPYNLLISTRILEFKVPKEGMSVDELLGKLTNDYPVLRDYLKTDIGCNSQHSFTLVIDNCIADPQDVLHDKSVVKILGPVSGG